MKRVMVNKELYMHLLNYCHKELKCTIKQYLKDSFKAYFIYPGTTTNGYAYIDLSDDAYYNWFILRWSS